MYNSDLEPVLLIMDKDGYVIEAGDPTAFKPKALQTYLLKGYQAKTITIKEYRETRLKWIYDKPDSLPNPDTGYGLG